MNIYRFLYALSALFAAQILRTYLASFREEAVRHKTAYCTTWTLYLLLQYLIAASDSDFHPLLLILANILLMTLIQVFSGSGGFRTALFRSGTLTLSWMAVEMISHGILLLAGNADSFLVRSLISKIAMYIMVRMYRRWRSAQTLMERQNRAYAQEINLCVRQAADREEAYQQTRTLRHDLKVRLVALSALLEAGQTENAKKEIEKMLAENSLNRNGVAKTGNLALDALVNYKYDAALSEGIRMQCSLETPPELFVEGTDLCIILGNLLDNALEAVQKISEEAKHWISLTVRLTKNALLIIVENPCTEEAPIDRRGRLRSHKTGDHGIGLLSVEKTVKKYAGELTVHQENGIFQASVMLVQPEI